MGQQKANNKSNNSSRSRSEKKASGKNTSRGQNRGSKDGEMHAKKSKFLKYKAFQNKKKKGDPLPSFSEDVRLNKFIANAGICSRREADVLIQTGVVKVNDEVILEMGYKVKPGDKVQYDGATISTGAKRYVLLNKPKGFNCSFNENQLKKSAMYLIKNACKETILPIDKLDKDTTGLMLFTNDSDLMKKLKHPNQKLTKMYHVETAKAIAPHQLKQLEDGMDLEKMHIKADKAVFVDKKTENKEVGLEIATSKSQVVIDMFSKLGHKVVKLDRVTFAGLTKKDLPRGYYRHLTKDEIAFLKMN